MVMEQKTEIDIIILSYAHNDLLKKTTMDCISSLIDSEDQKKIKFNIIVIESQKELNGYQYNYSKTIYPHEAFGFHRYMNIGIGLTKSPYVCLCNNDLIFHKNWASEILNYMAEVPDLMSASPLCSIAQPYIGFPFNSGIKIGYRAGFEIAGWCILVKREIFRIIGKLDENFKFTAADYDYGNTLAVLNLKHGLITSSIVDHLNSTTLNTHPKDKQDELNSPDLYYFKWRHRIFPPLETLG